MINYAYRVYLQILYDPQIEPRLLTLLTLLTDWFS
jgi:hypothetical protein